jgi:hypothetical protein
MRKSNLKYVRTELVLRKENVNFNVLSNLRRQMIYLLNIVTCMSDSRRGLDW